MEAHAQHAVAPFWQRLASTLMLLLVAAWAMRAGYLELETRWLEHEVVAAENAARDGVDVRATVQALDIPDASRSAPALRRELLARAIELLAPPGTPQQQRTLRFREARAQLRAAAAQRPSWPYVWAELAVLKAREGAFDAEFLKAFRRALALGPNESRVLQQLLGIVLRYSERVDDLLAAETAQILQKSARRDPARLFEQASRYHRAAWLCAGTNLDAGLAYVCDRRGFRQDADSTQ